jgi:hypothetical protein
MQVDHHFEENLTPDRVDKILGALRSAPTPHEDQTPNAGGVAGGSAGAPKARRRGVPATTGPALTEPALATSETGDTPLTTPKEPSPSAITGPSVKPKPKRRGKAAQ